jgi:hypothetical protein
MFRGGATRLRTKDLHVDLERRVHDERAAIYCAIKISSIVVVEKSDWHYIGQILGV